MACRAPHLTLILFLSGILASAQYAPPIIAEGEAGMAAIHQGMQGNQYETLLSALNTAGLSDLIGQEEGFTLFAPSDLAFKHFTPGKFAKLLKPENRKDLRALLTYHIISGKLTAARILKALCRGSGYATFTTIQGNEIVASMDGIDILLTDCSGNTARITLADTNLKNGVIHLIDRVILPN